MIYLFTALYPEAQGLISRYHLKKEISSGLRFQTFYNEKESIRLTITGAGEIAAACAVSSICIKYGAGVGDFLVNLGICAADATRGSLFFCHKLMEQATGKTFYPDILYAHECMEATLITSSVVQSQRKMQESAMQQKAEDIVLYDMEAAAVYQAGSYFFGPHQMSFLKVVSDFGEEQRIKTNDVAAIMDANADKIDIYLKMLKSLEDTSEKSDPKAEEESLYQDLHCSETMRADLRQHLRYWKLSGIHYEAVLEQMYEDGRLPCRDKREGNYALRSLNNNCYNLPFSHIYVEREVLHHPQTKKILEHFPKAKRIIIDHYKDIFCRSGQDYEKQHCAQKLILAAKHGALLYEGAPVCQSFGNQNFYYTSCVMNCVYDCEYCYLKGMYPSGNLVIFVNLEDIFEEVAQKLKEHSMYVCVSYDADLLAMEPIAGYVAEWNTFVEEQNRIQPGRLKIEVRTKCADSRIFEKIAANSGVIWAFTLSPQQIIDDFEHRTPSLKQRLSCAAEAMKKGFPVRLCFDPMLYCKDWKKQYEEMLYQVAEMMDMERLVDVSVGTFRVSQEYLKKMRKGEPDSAVVQFPYQNDGGVCHYPTALMEEMEGYLVRILENWLPAERIFRWQNEEE